MRRVEDRDALQERILALNPAVDFDRRRATAPDGDAELPAARWSASSSPAASRAAGS